MKEEKQTEMIAHKRIVNLDIERVLAIMCVVLCHSVELIYNMDFKAWTTLSSKAQIYRTIMFTIGRLGVPIFLLLSGYLLLSRKYENDEDIFKFYKKNLLSLLITTEIWTVIYNIFFCFYNKSSFNVTDFIKEAIFVKEVPIMNMWYMPMIIGIYIAIPYVSKVVKSFSIKALSIPMIAAFIIIFVFPTINVIIETKQYSKMRNIIDTSFLGGIYGIYMVLGFFSQSNKLKKFSKKSLTLIMAFTFVCACWIQIYSLNRFKEYNIWYDSPFLLLCSTCLFELIMRIDTTRISEKIRNMFTYISKISFAIFFMHSIVELVLKDYIKLIPIANCLKLLILFVGSFSICVLMTWILNKIKIIRKILFFKSNRGGSYEI